MTFQRIDTGWQQFSNCLDRDPELFFSTEAGAARRAKAICGACLVKGTCLEYAMAAEAPAEGEGIKVNLDRRSGIYGGVSARQRWALQFPEHAAKLRERDKAYYDSLTPEEKRSYRGKNDDPAQREAKRARDKAHRLGQAA